MHLLFHAHSIQTKRHVKNQKTRRTLGETMNMKKLRLSLIGLLVVYAIPIYSVVDLETLSSDCVINSKQVITPEYPHAFNPSIIRWHGRLLMSVRVIPDAKKSFEGWLGLVWVDEHFEQISAVQKLVLRNP